MEESEFCRNLRGVNAGQDFPKAFLSAIYHSICKGETTDTGTHLIIPCIKLPDAVQHIAMNDAVTLAGHWYRVIERY